MINAYNPVPLKHWRANRDIQLIGNANSCAYYICKYVCKAEPQELQDALQHLFTDEAFTKWYRLLLQCQPTTTKGSPRLQLQHPFNNKYIVKRQKFVIVRPTQMNPNKLDYYYACLLLYKSHRHEDALLSGYPTPAVAFVALKDQFDTNAIQMHNQGTQIDNAIRKLRLSQLQEQLSAYNNNMNLHPDFVSIDTNTAPHTSDNLSNTIEATLDSTVLHSQDMDWHHLCITTTNSTTLEYNILHLSTDQSDVFNKVRSHFQHQLQPPLRLLITGRAGTGKSFLLNTIVDWLKLCCPGISGRSPVIVAAPTGVAAKNINGFTLHSILKLPIQRGYESDFEELSSPLLQKLQQFFRGIHTIIIDECSMVSSKMFNCIHSRLCSIGNSNEPFGNYNIIIFGDFFQLRPVRGHYIFKETILWPLFQPYFLTINHMHDNKHFVEMLNRIHVGHVTFEDVALLSTRLLQRHQNVNTSTMLHIYPTLKLVREHNSYQQQQLNPTFFTHCATHIFASLDVTPGQTVPSEYIPEDDRHAGGLPNTLQLSVGTRVMLLYM